MKKFLSMLLILALAASVFTACGDKPASSGSTTDAPAASSSEPEPQEPPYDPAVLTGLPKSDDYPEGQRVTAVMVNNISNTSYQQARPQNGLSEADVLIEIKVEGGITRFCALFTDYRDLPEICPVRSARDQFFQLILPLQPLYVHIGESVVQTQYVKDYSYQDMDLNLDRMGDFPRDASKGNVAREHTAYVDGDFIQKAIDALGADTRRDYTSPIFDFVNYNEPARVLTGDNALGITIEHSQSYRTYFDWDAAAGKYLMSQYSYAAISCPAPTRTTARSFRSTTSSCCSRILTCILIRADPATTFRKWITPSAAWATTSTAERRNRSAGKRALPLRRCIWLILRATRPA